MDYTGKTCSIPAWDASGAEVKASFDTAGILAEYQTSLVNQLTKEGLVVSSGSDGNPIVVKGKFVRIDEGNRWLRYFLTLLAGHAVIEMEGELLVDGRHAADLNATAKQAGGLFGGASDLLLKSCAKQCAKQVSKQVVSSLKKS
jgi:hypothetical protein